MAVRNRGERVPELVQTNRNPPCSTNPSRESRGNSSRNSLNSRNHANAEEARKRKKCFKIILGCLTLIAVPVIIIGIKNLADDDGFSIIGPNRNYPKEYTASASNILKRVIEVCNDMMLYQLQIETFLSGERLATLLKEKLQPIQNRLASLRTQTSNYEKMQRVPGGPKSFIQSTLDELEMIENVKLVQLDQEASQVIIQEALLCKSIRDSLDIIMLNGHFALDMILEPKLTDENIYITPVEGFEDEEVEDLMTKVTLDEVLARLATLVTKLEKYEKAADRIITIENKLGPEKFQQVVEGKYDAYEEIGGDYKTIKDAFLKWDTEIERDTTANERFYQLLIPLVGVITEKVSDLQVSLLEYTGNKRQGFLTLKSSIEKDIQKLKLRVQNLRYQYAKIS